MQMKVVNRTCTVCKEPMYVEMPVASYEAYALGLPLHKAWPSCSVTESEILVYGICPACQGGTLKDE